MNQHRIIELTEHKAKVFDSNKLNIEIAELIWKNYPNLIDVEFPSIKTKDKTQLKPKGWVGQIPLTPELQIFIKPKVSLSNLFGMLEYAYDLKSFKVFNEDLTQCQSIDEFYSKLAELLAQNILARIRRGLYRTYISANNHLSAVRGRIDIKEAIRKPWNVKLKCHYDEHTVDIEDNQILLWTLYVIGRSGLCSTTVSPTIRKAYHFLNGLVTRRSFTGNDCVGRSYNRLNQDYKSLHALCRFFLDHCGASHQAGNYIMIPFLVDMAKLYEKFVAKWLEKHLPSDFSVRIQERVNIGDTISFCLDIAVYEKISGKTLYILDTKYKVPDKRLLNSDIYQVTTYAVSKNCSEAVLVYPETLNHSLDEEIGQDNVRLRSLTFTIDEDLEQAGQAFLKSLLGHSHQT